MAVCNRALRDTRVADTMGVSSSGTDKKGRESNLNLESERNNYSTVTGTGNRTTVTAKPLSRPRPVRHLPWVIGLVSLIPTYVALTNCLELFYCGPRSSDFYIQLACLLSFEFYRDTLFYVRLYEYLGWIYPKVTAGFLRRQEEAAQFAEFYEEEEELEGEQEESTNVLTV